MTGVGDRRIAAGVDNDTAAVRLLFAGHGTKVDGRDSLRVARPGRRWFTGQLRGSLPDRSRDRGMFTGRFPR